MQFETSAMLFNFKTFIISALGLVSTIGAFGATCVSEDFATRVSGGGECVVIATYGQPLPEKPSALVVWIHGDQTDGRAPTSHVKAAQAAAARFGDKQVLNIALWRPGYANVQGEATSGTNYHRTDTYTKSNMAIVGDAIERLKSHLSQASCRTLRCAAR